MPHRHLLGFVAAVSLAMPLGGAAGQGVLMFEEPPPLELLRSIMIPETGPGLSRRIMLGAPAPTWPAAASVSAPDAAPPSQVPASAGVERGPAMAAARPPAPVRDAPSGPVARPARDSIGFRVNFTLNSHVVPMSAHPFLDRIAELMRDQSELRLRVEGYTDALGSDAYNLDLSRRRAMSVAAYLTEQQGVEAERIVVAGYGKQQPLVQNPFDGRNRRVQFTRVE